MIRNINDYDYVERIKKLKSEKKLTNDRLAELTGIPLGTLSKILAGMNASPKISNIVAICDALETTVDYIVSGVPENTNNYTLEPGEIRLVETFRKLDEHGKELTTLVMTKEAERLTKADYLPQSGEKARILPSVTAASAKGRYQSVKGFGKRTIVLYDMPASAGTGVYLDEDRATEIVIPENDRTEEADFALRISGNSMEPKFHTGDVLLVSETDAVEVGELGIFVLDGEGYFKSFGGDRLLSLNPDYGPILLKDYADVRCIGKVVGKLRRK